MGIQVENKPAARTVSAAYTPREMLMRIFHIPQRKLVWKSENETETASAVLEGAGEKTR